MISKELIEKARKALDAAGRQPLTPKQERALFLFGKIDPAAIRARIERDNASGRPEQPD